MEVSLIKFLAQCGGIIAKANTLSVRLLLVRKFSHIPYCKNNYQFVKKALVMSLIVFSVVSWHISQCLFLGTP